MKQETEEDVSNGATEAPIAEESSSSSIQDLLWGYKDALASNDEGAVSEYEKELELIAIERDSLGQKVNALIKEILTRKQGCLLCCDGPILSQYQDITGNCHDDSVGFCRYRDGLKNYQLYGYFTLP